MTSFTNGPSGPSLDCLSIFFRKERVNTNFSHGNKKVFQDPRKSWTSKFDGRLGIDLQQFELKWRPRVLVEWTICNQEIDTIEFEGVGLRLHASELQPTYEDESMEHTWKCIGFCNAALNVSANISAI